jgi:hypothetical protein
MFPGHVSYVWGNAYEAAPILDAHQLFGQATEDNHNPTKVQAWSDLLNTKSEQT